MKKNLLFIGLLLAMSLTASAQYKGFSFGLKFGPNFNWIGSKTGTTINEGTKTGFDMGFVAEYFFAENYALVTGVNVDFLRGHYSFEDMRDFGTDSVPNYLLGNVDRYFKTTVYEIPLMLKLVTPEIGTIPLRAYAQLGAAFGYTHRVKVMDTFTLEGEEDPAIRDNAYMATKGEYNPFHVSLRVGAGAEYAVLETTRIFLGLYYSYDFLNSISSGAQGLTSNYRKYYAGNPDLPRDLPLDVRQHRIGIEVGVLF